MSTKIKEVYHIIHSKFQPMTKTAVLLILNIKRVGKKDSNGIEINIFLQILYSILQEDIA